MMEVDVSAIIGQNILAVMSHPPFLSALIFFKAKHITLKHYQPTIPRSGNKDKLFLLRA